MCIPNAKLLHFSDTTAILPCLLGLIMESTSPITHSHTSMQRTSIIKIGAKIGA